MPIQNVNIELGDDASKMLGAAAKLTYENRPGLVNSEQDSFRGFKAMDGAYFGDITNHNFQIGLDGTGTKVEIAERTRDHTTIAHDLFAMICDDAVMRGGEPLAVGSILDVRQFNQDEYTKDVLRQICTGYVDAAERAGVVVVNGETAELGPRVGGYVDALFSYRRIRQEGFKRKRFNYNWGGVVLWFALKERVLDGQQLHPGDSLVGLAEPGFRSNGITDVRRILREHAGRDWHDQVVKEFGDIALGPLVQRPSVIYSKLVNDLTGGHKIEKNPMAKVTGVAHITGGGQPSKLGSMLKPSGYGALIDDPIDPPAMMREMQRLDCMPDRDTYGKWHMGPGMIIATPDPLTVVAHAAVRGIEAKKIGVITEGPGIRIKNRGVQQQQEFLHF